MNAKTSWNNQSKTDTVAFSALIATAMLLAWIAAAAPIADQNATLNAATNSAPAMTRTDVQHAEQTRGSRIVVTAGHLTIING